MRSSRWALACEPWGCEDSEKCPLRAEAPPPRHSYPETLPCRDILPTQLHSMTLGLCAHSWVLHEQPGFQGQKLVLPQGDTELGAPGSAWSTQGIGSLRRVVRVSGWVWGTRCCLIYPKSQALRRKTETPRAGISGRDHRIGA